ncbi:hypothetical protein Tco_0053318 [Tanacetum coccineum]
MSSPKFAEKHNVSAFLEKPVESDGFAEIIDFLKASSVHYALTVNLIIYTSCIEQFWATAKVQTVNGVRPLQALFDKKRVIITDSSIRSDLHLDDAEGTDCLPTATIFEELARMGISFTLLLNALVHVTQEKKEEIPKEPTAKRKKSIPRKTTRKRQKLEEDVEKDELKGFLDVVPREETPIEIESLSTKFPIVDWKTVVLTETFMYYQVFRGDGSSKNYKILSEMLQDFDRMDVEQLFRLVKERYSSSAPEGFDLMLWGDLHTLFEPDEDDEIWKDQHEYNLLSWRLCDFCGIHILLMNNGLAIHMLTEKKYPLSQEMLSKMLSTRLEVDHESSQAFELLRFIRAQGRIVGNKSSYDLILPTVLKGLVLPAQECLRIVEKTELKRDTRSRRSNQGRMRFDELCTRATPICEGLCRLTSLGRQKVWNDCRNYKVRVGSNGNLLWEASVLLGRKKGSEFDFEPKCHLGKANVDVVPWSEAKNEFEIDV